MFIVIEKIKFRLDTLGEPKVNGNQLKYNCPLCESKGGALNKYNLEVNISRFGFNCWACNYHGHINKLIKEQGLGKDFVFKSDISTEENKYIPSELKLPDFLIHKFTDKQKEHFKYRGILQSKIIKYDIYNIFSGLNKNKLCFNSYNINNELNYFLIYDLINKKYQKPQGVKNNIMFWESKIDYNFPITVTEGLWDSLATINSFPMLGLKLNERMLYMLSNRDILMFLDEFVLNKQQLYLEHQLREICNNFEVLKVPEKMKDPSYLLGTKNNFEFKNYYLKTIQQIANNTI